jgi:hypothetical protein
VQFIFTPIITAAENESFVHLIVFFVLLLMMPFVFFAQLFKASLPSHRPRIKMQKNRTCVQMPMQNYAVNPLKQSKPLLLSSSGHRGL